LQLVSLAYALPQLAAELPTDTWWFLIERLQSIASQARTQRVDWNADPCDVVRNQLLAGELPLALSYLFPEVRALHELRDEARSVLTEAITELTDGQGLPHARLLPVLGPLFACWTRSRLLGKRLKGGAWSAKAERQYEWMVRHTIRLAANNHQFALATSRTGETASSTDSASIWCNPLFETALGLAGDRGDFSAAVRALPAHIVHKPKRFKKAKPPKPSLNSDWAGITVMSDGWSPTDARLAAKYLDRDVTIELAAGGVPLFAGQWGFQVHCDGQPVHPIADWEQSCWESGKKYDFLELSIQLSSGLRLERQIVFGRADRVLYLAEMLIDDDAAPRRLQFSSQLPLAHGATWNAESETRDGTIIATGKRAAVMPLGLREWRSDPRSGAIYSENGQLTLTQETRGRAICCPLLIDLDSARSTKERTWRQLTVGENLEIIPPDVAVGYRAQSGDDQWLFYRSLGAPGNRTLLGHNCAGEFCAGRFRSDGKFKEWLEIEAV
jgi:hypothetical protein